MVASPTDPPRVSQLSLVSPTVVLRHAMVSMAAAFDEAGERFLRDDRMLMEADFAAYVRMLRDRARGVSLPPGWVPYDTYWLVLNKADVVGVSTLRHRLTPALEDLGGHIGYAISPRQRRNGFGTAILALTLAKARERGLGSVLVTCDSDNVASARIIEKNGGRLSSESYTPLNGKIVRRYWIDLTCQGRTC